MLTYSPIKRPKRKDRPWLLFLTALIWVCGTCFFHEPWEPYEPYVVAVVKSIISTNSWLIPYIANNHPYLELQPFYFWFYAIIIKLFNFSNIANAIRIINSLIILITLYSIGHLGSRLNAYKSGRSVVMIFICLCGVINNAYQLSPNIVVILGTVLFLLSLAKLNETPGSASGILTISLILLSINFTAEYILIAAITLILTPFFLKSLAHKNYFLSVGFAIIVYILFASSYVWMLYNIDPEYLHIRQIHYISFLTINPKAWLSSLIFIPKLLIWYVLPAWLLVIWTIYKKKSSLFNDNLLNLSVIFSLLLLIFAIFSGKTEESVIFPILVPLTLLAASEIDSIKITIVAWLNGFCIVSFTLIGSAIFLLYIALNFGHPIDLLTQAEFYAPSYQFHFNIWQVLLAILVTIIWIFMLTRRQIRGREAISNWASGTTFCLILFIALCLPWFNSVLSFKDIVNSSIPYLNTKRNQCIATTSSNQLQNAIWYYYANIRLTPLPDFKIGVCDQALITLKDNQSINLSGWKVIWSAKRPVDSLRYILLNRN